MSNDEENTLPEGWILKPLGDIAFLKSGSTPRRSNNSFWNKGTIPWLKSGELNDVMGIKENSEFITEIALNETSVKLFEKDTLLIAMYGATAGKLGILSINATTNQAVCSIQNIYNKFDNHYIFYFLFSSRQEIVQDSFGGAQPNISKSYLEKITIPLPPLEEQKRIVAKIDTLFTKIDKAITLTEESLKQAKNLFPSVLKEVFEKGKAEGWEEKMLGEFAQVKGGKRLPKGEKLEENKTPFPYIRVTDFNDYGSVNKCGIKYISKVVYEHIKKYTISSDDVYISIAGTIGKTGVIPDNLNGANLTENAAKIVINNLDEIKTLFLYYFTLSGSFLEQINEKTKTAAQPKLALTRLREVIIYYPTFDEQVKVISVFDLIRKQTEQTQSKLEEQLAYLKQLKSSILSKAFKGEL